MAPKENQELKGDSDSKSTTVKDDIKREANDTLQNTNMDGTGKIHPSSEDHCKENIYEVKLESADGKDSQEEGESLSVTCSSCGTSNLMTPDQLSLYCSVASFCKEQLELCKDHYCIL